MGSRLRYSESYRTARTGGLVNNFALRNRLLDTDPATAFNPIWHKPEYAAGEERDLYYHPRYSRFGAHYRRPDSAAAICLTYLEARSDSRSAVST